MNARYQVQLAAVVFFSYTGRDERRGVELSRVRGQYVHCVIKVSPVRYGESSEKRICDLLNTQQLMTSSTNFVAMIAGKNAATLMNT